MLERSGCVVQCGREFREEEVEQIRETVSTFWRLSRKEVALTVCEHLGWSTASGAYKVDACLKLLNKLEVIGVLRLPEKQGNSRRVLEEPEITARTEEEAEVTGEFKDLGRVNLRVVTDREERGLWNEYLSRYHYLGYRQPFGCQLRYFVENEARRLGCLLFSGAAKALRVRDGWIGWSESSRLRNLGWVVNNSRFLIFPWVKVKNLSSHVLGQAARRIGEDWEERWSYRPVLLETFVDPRYFAGTCYRAANWRYLGMTTGEGFVRKGKSYTTSAKQILVKPLVAKFREILCS